MNSALSRQAQLQREIRAVYSKINPSKIESGEVDSLLTKYRGEEGLLLRRVQYHYGLVVISGRLWRRDEASMTWRRVRAILRADGLLHWSFEKPGGSSGDGEGEDMDVRFCAVDEWDKKDAGRPLAFAVFSSSENVDAVLTGHAGTTRKSLLVAAAENADEKRRWIEALSETAEFFSKLRHERECQSQEELAQIEAMRESERAFKIEQERRKEIEAQAALDTLRAAARSRLEQRPSFASEDDSECEEKGLTQAELTAKLGAELEAALDDALFATSAAADAESSGDARAAHHAYRDAVSAFLVAKTRIETMRPHERPERQVLVLIDEGSEQCKSNADALRSQHRQHALLQSQQRQQSRRREQKPPSEDSGDVSRRNQHFAPTPHLAESEEFVDEDDYEAPPFHDLDAVPRLDNPQNVPAGIEKLIIDTDDL